MGRVTFESTVVRSDSQVSTKVEDEAIVLHLESGHYFSLNEVGALIWEALEQPRTADELCQIVLKQYEVSEEECRRDTLALLDRLNAEGMLRVG